MNLYYIQQELKFAKEDFHRFTLLLNDTVNFSPLDPESYRYWNTFIDHLCNSFNKVENLNKNSKGEFKKIVSVAIDRQRNDPLLRYVRECRNAYQHSNQEMCTLEMTSKIPTGEPMGLTRMAYTDADGNFFPEETTYHDMFPATVQLKTVVNRGTPYSPPTMHLGQKLKTYRNAIEVGTIAILYYENLYKQLEALPD
jgi:hypothetical protein